MIKSLVVDAGSLMLRVVLALLWVNAKKDFYTKYVSHCYKNGSRFFLATQRVHHTPYLANGYWKHMRH